MTKPTPNKKPGWWRTLCRDFARWFRRPAHIKYARLISPPAQGLFWLLTFALAAYASLYSAEIRDVSWPTSENRATMAVNWHTVVFGVSLLAAALYVAFSTSIKASREEAVMAIMQTNPPAGFLKSHYEAVERANSQLAIVEDAVYDEKPSLDDCYKAVRVVLSDIINLMMEWDAANLARKVVYRANIMEVIHFSEQPDFELDPQLQRFSHPPEKEHYSGIVLLKDDALSTNTINPQPVPDDDIEPIAFPFTFSEEESDSKFHTNLRGAPYSVASGVHDYVGDIETIINHYHDNAEPHSDGIERKLESYYLKKGFPAHSILSIPLFGNNASGKKVVRYVLNLYRNQPGLLYDGVKATDFVYVAGCLTATLESMLERIQEATS